MSAAVFILGGWQSDFGRNWAREGATLAGVTREVVEGTLGDAAIDASDVGVIHVGNAFGELFTGQAHLGALPATVFDPLWGTPASRHEAACASGSIAALAAMAELEAGRYDCALVLGVEQERNVTGELAARHLGAAAWVGHEGDGVKYLWPHMFSLLGEAYERRFGGLRREHLAAIAKKNFANARANPNAQTRSWAFSDASFSEDDAANPVIEGMIRRQDCGQVTDGGCGLVLANAAFAARWASARGRSLADVPRVLGWGHRTAGLSLSSKLAKHTEGLLFPHVNAAITDALTRARVDRADALDCIETHDCFTTTEYMAIDHFGLTAPGEGWKAIEEGRTERTGTTPINPSGGLIGGGHPVGATGVRMLLDASRQVAGRAGATQIDDATRVGTLNIGGSAATAVSFVVGTGEPS